MQGYFTESPFFLLCELSACSIELNNIISFVSGSSQHRAAAPKARTLNIKIETHSIPMFTTNGATNPPIRPNVEHIPIAEFLMTVGNISVVNKYVEMKAPNAPNWPIMANTRMTVSKFLGTTKNISSATAVMEKQVITLTFLLKYKAVITIKTGVGARIAADIMTFRYRLPPRRPIYWLIPKNVTEQLAHTKGVIIEYNLILGVLNKSV